MLLNKKAQNDITMACVEAFNSHVFGGEVTSMSLLATCVLAFLNKQQYDDNSHSEALAEESLKESPDSKRDTSHPKEYRAQYDNDSHSEALVEESLKPLRRYFALLSKTTIPSLVREGKDGYYPAREPITSPAKGRIFLLSNSHSEQEILRVDTLRTTENISSSHTERSEESQVAKEILRTQKDIVLSMTMTVILSDSEESQRYFTRKNDIGFSMTNVFFQRRCLW